jgi:hypothetical protein
MTDTSGVASTPYTIPLVPQAQTLAITLAGVNYNLNVYWNVPNNSWMLDLLDDNGNPILTGVPLVTGADLLEQFAYLGIGGQLIVQTTDNPNAVPTYTDLGSTGNLYFVVPASS